MMLYINTGTVDPASGSMIIKKNILMMQMEILLPHPVIHGIALTVSGKKI